MSKAIKEIYFHWRLTPKVHKILLKDNFQQIFYSNFMDRAVRYYEKKETEFVNKAELFIAPFGDQCIFSGDLDSIQKDNYEDLLKHAHKICFCDQTVEWREIPEDQRMRNNLYEKEGKEND